MTLDIKWIDSGREPRCPPDPAYPHGVDLDLSNGASVACHAALPYPAPRCGYYSIRCDVCGLSALITTAGRADDPRSVKVECEPKSHSRTGHA
jgi:hypothetical protein